MPIEVRRQVAKTIAKRYIKATKKEKKIILDEFCATFGYHRKSALRLLRRLALQPDMPNKKTGPKPYYSPAVVKWLVYLWEHMRRPCGPV